MTTKSLAKFYVTALGVVLFATCSSFAQGSAPPMSSGETSSVSGSSVLKADDLKTILPPSVFFKGQTAPLQLRNSAAIHFKDGHFVLVALVDTSGYSSSVQEKYQAYFITETTLKFGSAELNPGAYGVGFVADNKFLVMDIGGHDLFTVDSLRDNSLKHPTPLHISAANSNGDYLLYAGRSYVTFHGTGEKDR